MVRDVLGLYRVRRWFPRSSRRSGGPPLVLANTRGARGPGVI